MAGAVLVDAKALPMDQWRDPARGTLRWKTLFCADQTSTSAMVCGIAEIQPGEHFALHSHPEAEVYFGLEGEGDVMVDGVAHRLKPGVALFIPGNAVHGVPGVAEPLRWFYSFASDRFAEINYRFVHEQPATPTANSQ